MADVKNAIDRLGKKRFRLNAKQVSEILYAAEVLDRKKRAGSKMLNTYGLLTSWLKKSTGKR
jgi:hypothetical protein